MMEVGSWGYDLHVGDSDGIWRKRVCGRKIYTGYRLVAGEICVLLMNDSMKYFKK